MKRFAVLAICISVGCMAAPTGFKTIAGNVKLKNGKKQQTILAKNNSVVHWDDFSVNLGEKVSFQMPNSHIAVLNRVVGKNPSALHGTIESNGRVYLVNHNGIVIGTNARINTAGFLATTGQIQDAQFLKGKDIEITNLTDAGGIDHRGVIATNDGAIYLIASQVKNSGKLIAPEGHVGIAVGQEVLIKPNGPEHIFIRPGKPIVDNSGKLFAPPAPKKDIAIENTGTIEALITEIKTHRHPYAEAIAHTGKIQATKLKKAKGRIYLVSEDHSVYCSGQMRAPEGSIKVDGRQMVDIRNGSIIDVSDQYRPGKIAIGSKQSQTVRIDKNAVMHADNLKKGNGGEISILSSQATQFEGFLTAEAKGSVGNGGKIEVSSVGSKGLSFRGKTSLKAKNGKDGLLFLDPKFAVISSDGTDPATGNTFGSEPSETVTISGASLSTALDSASVVIQANTDITFDDTVTSTTEGNGLTLQAGRSVAFSTNSSLTLNNGALNIKINDENADHNERLPGGAAVYAFGPATINTQGGNVIFDVGTCGGTQGGAMFILNTIIDAGGGDIAIHGYGCFENARGLATNIAEFSQILTSGAGTINITGTAVTGEITSYGNPHNVGYSNNFGIYMTGLVDQANLIQSENGNITITGVGAGDGVGSNNVGTSMSMTQIVTTGSGAITVSGTGGNGDNTNTGLIFSGSLSKIETTTGAIQVTAQGNGVGQNNPGFILGGGAKIAPTGAANITIEATGGSGTNGCGGMIIQGNTSEVAGQGGAITITANGAGSDNLNAGFLIHQIGKVTNVGSGTITIDGTASGTGKNNMGIAVSGITAGITSVDGDIDLTGTGSGVGPANLGVYIEYPDTVKATGTGSVNITDNSP